MRIALRAGLVVIASFLGAWLALEASDYCWPAHASGPAPESGSGTVIGPDFVANDFQPDRFDPPAELGMATDFELPRADGEGSVRLSDYRGRKPVALIFGSYSCPIFRAAAPDLRRIYQAHQDRVQFYFVYTREAHLALDGRDSWNPAEGVQLREARSLGERRQRCREAQRRLGLPIPALADTLDNRTATSYAAFPICLFLIDKTGKVVYRSSGSLPLGFKPRELHRAIEALTAVGS